jgi:SNF2 family DNA or RNA helicase
LWLWLYCKANHKDYPDGNLKRGQLLTTYGQLQEAMKYSYGCSKKVKSKEDIRRLHRARMINKRKTTRGLVVTICDYDIYQEPDNYGIHTGAHITPASETTVDPHYKQECINNDKNKEGGKPPNFSSKPVYLKTLDELARERADAAFDRAAKRFLEVENPA